VRLLMFDKFSGMRCLYSCMHTSMYQLKEVLGTHHSVPISTVDVVSVM
jgi:hypothetical protein